jgi:hypothetical protein
MKVNRQGEGGDIESFHQGKTLGTIGPLEKKQKRRRKCCLSEGKD